MTSAGGRVISLPECELVAVLSRDGAVRDRLWETVHRPPASGPALETPIRS